MSHVPVKQHKSFENGGRKAKGLRIIENQFEVLANLDEENVDSEGVCTTILSDNVSEVSGGTWVVDCRNTPESNHNSKASQGAKDEYWIERLRVAP